MKKTMMLLLTLLLMLTVSTALAEIRLTQVEGGMDGDVMELVGGSFAMQIEGSAVGEIYRIKLTGPSGFAGTFTVQDAFIAGEPYLFRVQISDREGEFGPLQLTVTGGGETVTREYKVRSYFDAAQAEEGGVATNTTRHDEPALLMLEPGVVSQEQYGIKWPGEGAVFSGLDAGSITLVYQVMDRAADVELRLAGEEDYFTGSSGWTYGKEDRGTYKIPEWRMKYDTPFEFKVFTEETGEVYTTTFTIKQEAPMGEAVEVEPVETLLTTRAPRLARYSGGRVNADEQFYDDVVAFMDAHLPRTITGVNKGKWGDYYYGYDNDRDKTIHFGSIMVAYPEGADDSSYFSFTDRVLDEMASLLTYTIQKHQSKYKTKPLSGQVSSSIKTDNTMTSSGFEVTKGESVLRVQPFMLVKNKKPLDDQLYIYLSLEGPLPSGFMSDCKDITWVCSKPDEVKALLDMMLDAATNLTLDDAVMKWYNAHQEVPQSASQAAGQESVQADTENQASSKVKIQKGCNIRSKPDGSSEKLGYATAGETYVCLGVADNGWYHIVLQDGREAYISGAFAKEIE